MPTYRETGVNIAEASRLVEMIRQESRDRAAPGGSGALGVSKAPGSRGEIGSFGAFFELPAARRPVLVSSTDGVGTKIEPALAAGRYREIGRDCVAMCANDILCHGARPLYFLDYLACGSLDAAVAAEIVAGMMDACEVIGCTLSGGETAEMPGVYAAGSYDVAGFIVGMVEADRLIDGTRVAPRDALIGLASSGVHSNGFSLIRALELEWETEVEGSILRDRLLTPTRLYGPALGRLLEEVEIHGAAHITGGGMPENVPRMSPTPFRYEVDRRTLHRDPVFDVIAAAGVPEEEMFRTFNMGVGMVLAVASPDAGRACRVLGAAGVEAAPIGVVREGAGLCIE